MTRTAHPPMTPALTRGRQQPHYRHRGPGAELRDRHPRELADRPHGDTPSAGNRVAPATALGDLGIVASWVLRQAPAGHFAGLGPQALSLARMDQHSPAARRFPPASAALTGTLAATAMTMLAGSDERAIDQIRALLSRRARPQRARPAGLPRPALAAAITKNPQQVPARPGPQPHPRRPDPLPRGTSAAIPDTPPRAAGRPRPGDPAAAMARVGDPADARPRVRGWPVPQHHRRRACCCCPATPAAPPARPSPPCTPTAAPWPPARCCGPGRRRPRHRAHRDQLPGRLPRHQRQYHRLPAPPRPHPRRDDHRRPVA